MAEEVLSSIRTVVAFGGEEKEAERYVAMYVLYNCRNLCRYGSRLLRARNEGLKKGFFSSLINALLFIVIFATYGLGFWSVLHNIIIITIYIIIINY